MVKKSIFLTCCLITSHLIAHENELVEKTPKNVDRYQMQVVMDKSGSYTEVYLLDKENGTIWRSKQGFLDSEHSAWIKLPPVSMQEKLPSVSMQELE